MSIFKVDHSKGEGFEPIKPGQYEVVVINYELKKANSGNNRVIVDYEIRSDVDQPCQGQKILFDNFTVTDNAMWRFQQASKAAGFPDGVEFSSFKEWADAFLNKNLRLDVGEREYEGKKYPDVKTFLPSEAPPMEALEINEDEIPF